MINKLFSITIVCLKHYTYLSVLLFFAGCSNEDTSKCDIEDLFTERITLANPHVLADSESISDPYLLLVSGNYVFTVNARAQNILTVHDVRSGGLINEFLFRGRGENELLWITAACSNGSDISVYDNSFKRIVTLSSSDGWKDRLNISYESIDLNHDRQIGVSPLKAYPFTGLGVIASGVTNDNHQFIFYNPDGRVEYTFDDYPESELDKKLYSSEKGMVYQGYISINPEAETFMWASDSGTILKFFSCSGGGIKKVKEITCDYPDYTYERFDGGGGGSAATEKNRFSFHDAKCFGGNYYLLYNGTSYEKNPDDWSLSKGRKILVFDRYGEPLRMYILDRKILAFDLTDDGSSIICIADIPGSGIPELVAYDLHDAVSGEVGGTYKDNYILYFVDGVLHAKKEGEVDGNIFSHFDLSPTQVKSFEIIEEGAESWAKIISETNFETGNVTGIIRINTR